MILAIVDDLMFSSKLRSVAKAIEAPLRFSRSVENALTMMRAETPTLVILDLNNPRIDTLAIVSAMKIDPTLSRVPTVGFSQHTATEAIGAARTAGVDEVLARSAFFERLPEILSGK